MITKNKKLARLALAGLVGGSMTFGVVGCNENQQTTDNNGDNTTVEKDMANYTAIHDCSGMNICKGLGGCKVTEDSLKSLAKEAGIPMEKAGSAHDCKGHNECKGLGGCSIDMEKFKKLTTDGNYTALHGCSGKNICKGLGGCKVTSEKLASLAKAMNMPVEKAGSAHECRGHNECKGLGGCSVDIKQFEKLKLAMAK